MENAVQAENANKGKAPGKRLIYVIPVLTAYVVLNLILLIHHEAWRDEAQAWLIARSLGPAGILRQLSYEGHPCLWYFLLMPFAHAGVPFAAIGVISLVIMTAAAFLLLRYSPFHPILDLAILFSPVGTYFLPVIARSYALCAFFTIALAALYKKRKEHAILYCVLLALLVQTHLIMLGMAGALSVAFLIDRIMDIRRNRQLRSRRNAVRYLLPLLLPFLSFLALLGELYNVKGSTAFHVRYNGMRELLKALRDASLGVFGHITGLDLVFQWSFLILIAFALVYAFFVLMEPGPVLIFIFSAAAQMLIYVLIVAYTTQRCLTLVFIFIWFLWIVIDEIRVRTARRPESEMAKPTGLGQYHLLLLALCLAVTFGTGREVLADYNGVYSDGENAASKISGLTGGETVVTAEPARTSILAAYDPSQKYWSSQIGDYVTFTPLNRQWNSDYTFLELEEAVKNAGIGDADGFYLLASTDARMTDLDIWKASWEKLYETEGDTITDEKYTLYRVSWRDD